MAPGETKAIPANPSQRSVNLALASVAGLGGCLVLVIVVVALFSGLWLDNALNTKPAFTLVLVLGSVPVGIFVMYRVAMSIITKSLPPPKTDIARQGDKQL